MLLSTASQPPPPSAATARSTAPEARTLWQALAETTSRLWRELSWGLRRGQVETADGDALPVSRSAPSFQPLQRLLLTDGVSRTLFEEFAKHRRSKRGDEEIGWVLLGIREGSDAIALATLPAGATRNAGTAHVIFNETAQAIGAQIVRQQDRRLRVLGVVHTHPGSLRHPSDGDYRGDVQWVAQLLGKEGMFGIGTADVGGDEHGQQHPKPHVWVVKKLRFSWYMLRAGAARYQPLPVELIHGPDLARPLHAVWDTIETHAQRLLNLERQQARITFDVVEDAEGPALMMLVRLAEPQTAIRVLLRGKHATYFLERDGDTVVADAPAERVDQGVYLILAELAAQS